MNQILEIQFLRIDPVKDSDIPLPRYMSEQAAGMDVCIAIEKDITVTPGRIVLLPTGFKMAIPPGFEAQIRPRSGLAVNHGIGLINSPGTIDSDYRGEVKLAVINLGDKNYTFKRGDRVAQMVISRVYQPLIRQVEVLGETARNEGGFGHTGLRSGKEA